jgi:8-oxo-dGTP diphosphatase
METYVVGFCFNEDKSEVALIKKTHPEWQAGLFNGIGGHVNEDETPLEAMQREFKEEAGVDTVLIDWHLFAELSGDYFHLYCFNCFDDEIFKNIKTCTDEFIIPFPTACIKIRDSRFISNLSWLLGICLDEDMSRINVQATYENLEALTQER